MKPDEVQKRVLAVGAHPDDVEYTSGGSLLRWVGEGWAAQLVVCTDGSKGSQDPDTDPAALAEVRRGEQEEAVRALGVQELIWLGYPDGELTQAADLIEKLAYQIRVFRPDRMVSWDGWKPYQLHGDHRAAGMAAMDAVLAAGNPHFYPQQLTNGLEAYKVEEVYLYGTDGPDTWVDITSAFEGKMKAIVAHESQVDYLPELALKMSNCNQGHGAKLGYTYAEAFKVLRPFCDL